MSDLTEKLLGKEISDKINSIKVKVNRLCNMPMHMFQECYNELWDSINEFEQAYMALGDLQRLKKDDEERGTKHEL